MAEGPTGRIALTGLLLIPIAFVCLIAGLLPLLVAGVAAARGLHAGLGDPALAPSLHQALQVAALATVPAWLVGLAAAACLARTAHAIRWPVLGLAVCVLVVPAPALDGLPAFDHPSPRDLMRLACAVARGGALAMLIVAPALHRVTPGLRRAAMLAGARPWQAWRHVVLAPLWPSALAGGVLAFLVVLSQTKAAAILAPHFDLAEAWVAPASLVLVACSLAVMAALVRR